MTDLLRTALLEIGAEKVSDPCGTCYRYNQRVFFCGSRMGRWFEAMVTADVVQVPLLLALGLGGHTGTVAGVKGLPCIKDFKDDNIYGQLLTRLAQLRLEHAH